MPTYIPRRQPNSPKCEECSRLLSKHEYRFCDDKCQKKNYHKNKKKLRVIHDDDKKIRVQINSKTWIMIKADQDPVEAKKRWEKIIGDQQTLEPLNRTAKNIEKSRELVKLR